MSDARKPAPPSTPPPRTPSNPGTQPRAATSPGMRAVSAARAAPLEKPKTEGPLGKRVAAETSNVLLNAFSILKEQLADFRASDRFFKYKAGIVAAWVALSVASFAIACPGSSLDTGDMDARLVLSDKLDRPSVTIWNESKDVWRDVIITVNNEYKAVVAEVQPGNFVTITPKQLLGKNGGSAPADLRFQALTMKSSDDNADLTPSLQEEWKRLLAPKQ
ncbi:hypothetical protein D7W79_01470 [Corallococcus exercitus]|uniref:hypothetical protein n=1 Tax=Corallococcus exercitus TaxID=2316736 RepID=UPI000EA04704|nr:hypothetical protein [Corallococcus exercitus]RKG82851.1 hypothetical protein D7W79_01470 [Corallococcus exercitus]